MKKSVLVSGFANAVIVDVYVAHIHRISFGALNYSPDYVPETVWHQKHGKK